MEHEFSRRQQFLEGPPKRVQLVQALVDLQQGITRLEESMESKAMTRHKTASEEGILEEFRQKLAEIDRTN